MKDLMKKITLLAERVKKGKREKEKVLIRVSRDWKILIAVSAAAGLASVVFHLGLAISLGESALPSFEEKGDEKVLVDKVALRDLVVRYAEKENRFSDMLKNPPAAIVDPATGR